MKSLQLFLFVPLEERRYLAEISLGEGPFVFVLNDKWRVVLKEPKEREPNTSPLLVRPPHLYRAGKGVVVEEQTRRYEE